MTPTGFINGKDESRCYVKFSSQVIFFSIFFRQLIMNIDCEKIIEHMNNSEDDYPLIVPGEYSPLHRYILAHIFCT